MRSLRGLMPVHSVINMQELGWWVLGLKVYERKGTTKSAQQ